MNRQINFNKNVAMVDNNINIFNEHEDLNSLPEYFRHYDETEDIPEIEKPENEEIFKQLSVIETNNIYLETIFSDLTELHSELDKVVEKTSNELRRLYFNLATDKHKLTSEHESLIYLEDITEILTSINKLFNSNQRFEYMELDKLYTLLGTTFYDTIDKIESMYFIISNRIFILPENESIIYLRGIEQIMNRIFELANHTQYI